MAVVVVVDISRSTLLERGIYQREAFCSVCSVDVVVKTAMPGVLVGGQQTCRR